ncbi:hypothetical protein Micbo1qcDRAFT_201004 [Microdochium bolleyi]|uniref:HTH APSES-type domain-containing protein n=1 Tax=Microdochium bolleyi TaxID=196109 RepID=A0A136JER8_9PEZI|nr:hypothetical protein Micbo1qcDRAFT_201004 [Microdochium bolleyi]
MAWEPYSDSPQHKRMRIDSILNPSSQRAQSSQGAASSGNAASRPQRASTSNSMQSSPTTQRLAQEAATLSGRNGPKGDVNFPPFEDLDAATTRQLQHFGVYLLGDIQNCCRHIPYNSGKKDFQLKTGRDSFEVFQYTFTYPPGKNTYTVMWDYNVGLVRITPFFKCCGHPKTMPAKMLNLNPGLKTISHSITGGSIVAQGYWLPYDCAKAVCATFCHSIAPALIPIFGPEFPASCISPGCDGYEYMKINAAVVKAATREAETFRCRYGNSSQTGQSLSNLLRTNAGPMTGQSEAQDTITVQTSTTQQVAPHREAGGVGLKQSRTPLPRAPTRAYYPSPQTPQIRSPELPNHSSPVSTAYAIDPARSSQAEASGDPGISPDSSRPATLAHYPAERETYQHHLQTPLSSTRKRPSQEISGDYQRTPTGFCTGQHHGSREQHYCSPPETVCSSSVYSGAATRDNSAQSTPRQSYATRPHAARLESLYCLRGRW